MLYDGMRTGIEGARQDANAVLRRSTGLTTWLYVGLKINLHFRRVSVALLRRPPLPQLPRQSGPAAEWRKVSRGRGEEEGREG